jgi:hypothetical protein
LYREIIAVCSYKHTNSKRVNALWLQDVDFVNVETCGKKVKGFRYKLEVALGVPGG